MDKFIYSQKDIPKKTFRYGIRSSASAGCGWVATYNCLAILGYRAEPEQVIAALERQLPMVNGVLGTLALGPELFFARNGFRADHTSRPEEFDELAQQADATILFYHWRRGLRFGAHFAAVSKTEGGYLGYNVYSDAKGPTPLGGSIRRFLEQRGYFAPVLITVRKK